MNYTKGLLGFFSFAVLAFSSNVMAEKPHIKLTINTDAARALIDVIESDNINDDDINSLVRLEGIQSLITQAQRFDSSATETRFIEQLKKVSAGQALKENTFQLTKVKRELNTIKATLRSIENDKNKFSQSLVKRISAYAPEDVSFSTSINIIVGGTSDGFAPANGSGFYLALQYFDEPIGLELLASHELYHLLQQSIVKPVGLDKTGPTTQARFVLISLYAEGTASIINDPNDIPNPGSYVQWSQKKYNKNSRRLGENFTHFENTLYRVYHDSEIGARDVYSLGFSGGWDSPHYFVGYEMAQKIEQYRGRDVLVGVLSSPHPGVAFIREYIDLYNQNDSSDLIHFKSSIEKIVSELEM